MKLQLRSCFRCTAGLLMLLAGLNSAEVFSETKSAGISGQLLFTTYCSLCHGSGGHGDGRLSRVINDPPPANLVASNKPREYLIAIVTHGGAVMARSEKMPSWEHELGVSGVEAVVDYVMTLRK